MKFTNVKKWLAMLLAVCSMLSLVACGKSDKDSAGDDSEKGTPWASSGYIPSLRMMPSTRA